uniref:Uncharacterized protein n=1 Tax=Octopus bimaculoides TaxID=37653 RepID=A0A0L8GZ65_OCTBM
MSERIDRPDFVSLLGAGIRRVLQPMNPCLRRPETSDDVISDTSTILKPEEFETSSGTSPVSDVFVVYDPLNSCSLADVGRLQPGRLQYTLLQL